MTDSLIASTPAQPRAAGLHTLWRYLRRDVLALVAVGFLALMVVAAMAFNASTQYSVH